MRCGRVKKHKAAISIFLIIITIASVMLGGLFIDLSRILVAKNKVRTAAETALRSTLAGYSDDLVTEWGLFGLLDDDAEDDFKKYLRLNLSTEGSDGAANIISYEIIDDETSLTLSKPLSDSEVFSDKITEYEKFRAPVSLTLGTISKFKAIFGSNNEAAANVAGLDIEGTVNGLTTKLSNTFSNLSDIVTNLSGSVSEAGVEVDVSSDSDTLGEIDTSGFTKLQESVDSDFDDARNKVSEYSDSLDEYEAAGDEVQETADSIKGSVDTSEANGDITEDDSLVIDDNISTYTEDFETDDNLDTEILAEESKLLSETQNQTDEVSDNIDELQEETDALIADAKKKAEEYNGLAYNYNLYYNQLKNIVEVTSYSDIEPLTVSMVLEYDTKEKIASARSSVNSKYESITKKEEELEEALTKANAILTQYNNAKNLSEADLRAVLESTDSTVKTEYNYLTDYYGEYISISSHQDSGLDTFLASFYNEEYVAAQKAVTDKEEEIAVLTAEMTSSDFTAKKLAVDNEDLVLKVIQYKKEAVDYYNNTYKPALDKISDVNIQEESGAGSITDYSAAVSSLTETDDDDSFSMSELLNIADKIKDFVEDMNKELPAASEVLESDLEDDTSVFSIFGKLKNYFVSLGEVVTNADNLMDKVYLVDYIMSKCTYVTSQTSREHYFSRGEVEYIIFGHKSQWANIASAIGSITLMRFAINTINYFITSKDGELISRAVIAVTRGVVQTGADMTAMLLDYGSGDDEASKKGLIAVCPSLKKYKVLSYSDHLRILLLLKMKDDGGAAALRRCMHATLKEEGDEAIPTMSETRDYLGDYYTQAKATASVDVDLFFIPMFMPEAVNFGTIHDGKYRVSAEIEYGY